MLKVYQNYVLVSAAVLAMGTDKVRYRHGTVLALGTDTMLA